MVIEFFFTILSQKNTLKIQSSDTKDDIAIVFVVDKNTAHIKIYTSEAQPYFTFNFSER